MAGIALIIFMLPRAIIYPSTLSAEVGETLEDVLIVRESMPARIKILRSIYSPESQESASMLVEPCKRVKEIGCEAF